MRWDVSSRAFKMRLPRETAAGAHFFIKNIALQKKLSRAIKEKGGSPRSTRRYDRWCLGMYAEKKMMKTIKLYVS